VYKLTNNPKNRFLVQENHSLGTLHGLLYQNTENKKSQSLAAPRDFAQLLHATRCWNFLEFHVPGVLDTYTNMIHYIIVKYCIY
jgi:hypothetical protein